MPEDLVPRRQPTLIPSDLLVQQVVPTPDHVTIIATARQPTADCPTCCWPSGRVHSRYERRLHDLPWQGRPVILRLRARRFHCPNPACSRRTFTERIGHVAAVAGRRTGRLADLQRQVALATGGEAGSRLAGRLAMPASPDTLLGVIAESVQNRPLRTVAHTRRQRRQFGNRITQRAKPCSAV